MEAQLSQNAGGALLSPASGAEGLAQTWMGFQDLLRPPQGRRRRSVALKDKHLCQDLQTARVFARPRALDGSQGVFSAAARRGRAFLKFAFNMRRMRVCSMLAGLVRSWLSEVLLLLLLLEEERRDAFVAAKRFPHQTCFGSCPDCFSFSFH